MSDVSNIEIERRFLLAEGPNEAVMEAQPDFYVVRYEHGFLPGHTIRERVTRRQDIEPPFKRTVKIGTGKARYEFEETIDEETFQLFFSLTRGRRLVAKRWCVRDTVLTGWYAAQSGSPPPRKLKWEVTRVDLAHGLWLLEIETPTFCEGDPPFPVWLAPHVLREVTSDARYEAYHLAVDGIPR